VRWISSYKYINKHPGAKSFCLGDPE